MSLFNYTRRAAQRVRIGGVLIGGDEAIVLQSMTTVSTNDTEEVARQAMRIADAGGDIVRLTTQGVREAENLKNINALIRQKGYTTPLVADVHFNANVALVAAQYAEKVRINPGNYVDPARTFRHLEYTVEEYKDELRRIEERFVPLLDTCRKHHTAIRIGVNHGSLSDRIMSRYGDTVEGIVESCMEFLRIAKKENFQDIVISIKASNTRVMTLSMRRLVAAMDKEDMHYPLHLGVTEAGEGEDGRIKSAVGIGALLQDGIGDTIRVSLSEEPEAEIPVAKYLRDCVLERKKCHIRDIEPFPGFNPLSPTRRKTRKIGILGGENVPVVLSLGHDEKADYQILGQFDPKEGRTGKRLIIPYGQYAALEDKSNVYPLFVATEMPFMAGVKSGLKFLVIDNSQNLEEVKYCLQNNPECALIFSADGCNRVGKMRRVAHFLMHEGLENPLIFYAHYFEEDYWRFQVKSAADMGVILLDGLADGIMLAFCNCACHQKECDKNDNADHSNGVDTAFGILQAARCRTSKTEYISCPGCGRTLYDLRTTISRIKAATGHLTGLKIGIMGCIVNGPGEMADADYGYVGAARGKVSLYRKKECVMKNIPEEDAVDRLLELINADMNGN